MTTAVAKLAGIRLEASAPNAWGFVDGVDPFQAVFEVHNDKAKEILAASDGKEVELELTRSNGQGTLSVKALSVLGVWPTSKPWTTAVIVADRRWIWNRVPVSRSYNMRRRAGNTVRVGADNDAHGVTFPEVQYAPWSINGSSPWTAVDVLKDVLKQVAGKFDVSKLNASKALPIENLVLDDSGESAVARVLAFLPGNGIYVDENGVAVVYDRLDLDATAKLVLPKLTSALTGSSLLAAVTFERTRPRGVVVLFEREVEIRVDYLETAAGGLTGNVLDPKELRQCQNVLPCPDPTLDIPAGPWGPARKVHAGTWITFDEFFAAVATGVQAATFFGEPLPPFSADIVRQLWTPIGGLLLMVYAGANVAPDPVWSRRITTALAHYRQTFRLPPRWRDKIKSMRANRVRIVDTTTGTRAPADVWVDYCVRPTMKRLAAQPGNGQLFGWNVPAIGTDQSGDLTKTDLATVMPSRNVVLSVVDEDLALWRIDFVRAPDLGDADILPSFVDNIPNADPSESVLTWDYAKLAAKHRMAAIFTVAQAAPNDERRFHAVPIFPHEAGAVLGKTIGACKGPTWWVRVGLPAARFGWSDAGGFPAKFDLAFGAGEIASSVSFQATGGDQGGGDAAENAGQGDVRLADLGTPTNDDELLAVAKAAAASIYSSLIDRVEGGLTVPLDTSLRPLGSISGVMHSLMPDGTLMTSLSLPPNLAPVDMWAMVPDAIRRKILQQVQQLA